jgi:DNA-binding transcriptional LysR family regulator
MVIEAAVAGMGSALLPRHQIEQELKSGELRIVLTNGNGKKLLHRATGGEYALRHFFFWLTSQVRRPG